MKKIAKNYLKAVMIIFFIILIFYIIFELVIANDLTNFWQNILKLLFLAMLLPLFSQKYLSPALAPEQLKKFKQTSKRIYIFLGVIGFLIILLIFSVIIFASKLN